MKHYLREKLLDTLEVLGVLEKFTVTFEKPRQTEHGDLTTNVAMLLAKVLGKNPRAIAQEIVSALSVEPESVSKVEIAGPGFINFRFTEGFFNRQVAVIVAC